MLAGLLLTGCLFAQKRLVLIEEFTNTGCGPCASWSPILDSCINYRLGDCIAIKYHSNYPNRDDEFYLNEKESNQNRVDYYGVIGVPTTFIDGIEYEDRSFESLNRAIDYCQQQPAKYAITINKQIEGRHLTIKVASTPIVSEFNNEMPSEAELANLKLFVAAIEEHIESSTPWPNGEKELNYTMRKLNTSNLFTPTDLMEWETDLDSFDNLSQLGVLAFIQNVETREVLATAYSCPDAEGENQVALMNLIDTPDLICVPNYYGKVIFRNNGANTITSATLNVRVNNSEKQYPWTGSLGYLERDTLVFDNFSDFELVDEGQNEVWVWLSNINGSEAKSNMRTATFNNALQAHHAVRLKIYTDKKPEEITWKLYNSAGDIVAVGGPYDGQARKFITVDFDLTAADCYHIEFSDSGNDGIKGAAGNGYYQLFQVDENDKASRVAQGDYDGAVFDLFFSLVDAPAPPHRLVLFEEFTNTSCDPCAEFSPSLDKAVYDRMGDMVAITYHYNFPSPQDPFYLNNPTDAMARASFYDVTGVPSLRVNGEHVGAWGYEEYLDAYIDGAGAVAAKVNLEAEASMDDDLLTVNVSMLPVGYLSPESNLRLFVAAVEERIKWDKSAANGERSWNYVMRKLLPSADGQPVDAAQVTPQQFTFTWPVSGYTDPTELGLVIFVQDMATLQVLGTTYTPRPTGFAQAAKIIQVKDMPDRICSPEFSSTLVVRNTGKESLVSATLNVSVNGSVQQTPWTGALEPLAITSIRTPFFTNFALNSDKPNDVELWLSDLNGNDQTESVHKHFTLTNAVAAAHSVRLTIMTDQNPEETTWTLMNSAGDIVCQGGPYTEARKKQVIDLPLDTDDCYLIEFEDSGYDGIKEGRGYFMLHEVDANGKARLLVQDTYEEGIYDVYFSLHNAQSSSVPSVAMPLQQTEQPVYDAQGRPATHRSRLTITKDGKKRIND